MPPKRCPSIPEKNGSQHAGIDGRIGFDANGVAIVGGSGGVQRHHTFANAVNHTHLEFGHLVGYARQYQIDMTIGVGLDVLRYFGIRAIVGKSRQGHGVAFGP